MKLFVPFETLKVWFEFDTDRSNRRVWIIVSGCGNISTCRSGDCGWFVGIVINALDVEAVACWYVGGVSSLEPWLISTRADKPPE